MRVRHWKDFAESLWSWCLDHWKALGLSGQVPITEKSSYLFTELRNGGFIPSLGLEKFFEIMEAAVLRVLDGKIWPPHTKVEHVKKIARRFYKENPGAFVLLWMEIQNSGEVEQSPFTRFSRLLDSTWKWSDAS